MTDEEVEVKVEAIGEFLGAKAPEPISQAKQNRRSVRASLRAVRSMASQLRMPPWSNQTEWLKLMANLRLCEEFVKDALAGCERYLEHRRRGQ